MHCIAQQDPCECNSFALASGKAAILLLYMRASYTHDEAALADGLFDDLLVGRKIENKLLKFNTPDWRNRVFYHFVE